MWVLWQVTFSVRWHLHLDQQSLFWRSSQSGWLVASQTSSALWILCWNFQLYNLASLALRAPFHIHSFCGSLRVPIVPHFYALEVRGHLSSVMLLFWICSVLGVSLHLVQLGDVLCLVCRLCVSLSLIPMWLSHQLLSSSLWSPCFLFFFFLWRVLAVLLAAGDVDLCYHVSSWRGGKFGCWIDQAWLSFSS